MSDAAAQTVLSFYSFPPGMVRRIEPLGNAGGWSGSRVWRVSTADGRDLCLRRWPTEMQSPRHFRLIHSVLHLVDSHGLKVVPVPIQSRQGEPFVKHKEHYWDLAPWMQGTADFDCNPSRPRLGAALQTLARFHEYSAIDVAIVRPPAVIQRLEQLQACQQHDMARFFREKLRDAPLNSHLSALLMRILDRADQRVSMFIAPLQVARERRIPVQPAIRDIHRDHVLFTGNEVTGVIDFGAMRIDTPLTDIARLVGSLVGNDPESRRAAMDAYADLRPLCAEDRALVDLLDESGVVLAAFNWLGWLCVDRRDMGPPEPIIRRLDEILRRLEHLAAR